LTTLCIIWIKLQKPLKGHFSSFAKVVHRVECAS
jgi:hypothetical protein